MNLGSCGLAASEVASGPSCQVQGSKMERKQVSLTRKNGSLRTPGGAGKEEQMTNIETGRSLVAVSRSLCSYLAVLGSRNTAVTNCTS